MSFPADRATDDSSESRAAKATAAIGSFAIGVASIVGLVAVAALGSFAVPEKTSASRATRASKPEAKLASLSALSSTSASASVPASSSAPTATAPSVVATTRLAAPIVVEAPRLAIAAGSRVLVFGDSMVDAGFSQRLEALVKERGGTLVHDAWTSSSTGGWSRGDRLTHLLAQHADVIIVALGANEVSLPAPESVAPSVRSIVGRIAAASNGHCLWVGPPIWKSETGIVGVERDNASPCSFYDSGSLTLERRKDGIHTTMKGGAKWADAVWDARVDALPTDVAHADVPRAPSP